LKGPGQDSYEAGLDAVLQRLRGSETSDQGKLPADVKTLLVEYERLRSRIPGPADGAERPGPVLVSGAVESLLEQLPEPAVVCDRMGVIVQANPRARGLFGFRSQPLMTGYVVKSLLPSARQSDFARCFDEVATAGTGASLCLWVELADHGPRYLELLVSPLDPDELTGMTLLVRFLDRTDEQRRLERLEHLARAVESAPVSLGVFDHGGVCQYANAQFRRDLRRDADQVIGHTRDAWLSEPESRKWQAIAAGVQAGGVPHVSDRLRAIHGQRERRDVYYVFAVRDAAGDITGTAEVSAPTHRMAERDLRLQLSVTAYEMSREGVIMTDAEGRILSVNPAFERITGYTESEVRGKNPRLLRSGRHDEGFYRRLWQTLAEHGLWEGEIWNRRKSGEVYPQWSTISRISDDAGRTLNYIAVVQDITQKKSIEEELEHLAFYDHLTGAANRFLLADRADLAIRNAAREGYTLALAYFDLDHFKPVNDTHGHRAGDLLLQRVAKRVSQSVREKDTLARVGGDEFALLLADIGVDDLRVRLGRLLLEINRPYRIEEHELQISASMGVALYPDDGEHFDQLLRAADNAMYLAKRSGRGIMRFASYPAG
jgi:two-component system CheB/CheR fusion protein